MPYINKTIHGTPYPEKRDPRLDQAPLKKWTHDIITQTQGLPKVKKREACLLRVTFLLKPSQFPKNCRFGPDLDNLLKRFLNALKCTVLSEADGTDSCVVAIEAMKVCAETGTQPGAELELLPVRMPKQ
jgi:Holliday junction resolvase RusA-like endonuclease